MPTESRSDVRKQRYKYLTDLGFSRDEATRLRDRSGIAIEAAIREKRNSISRKSISRRTVNEKSQLGRIRSASVSKRSISDRRILTRRERRDNFAKWSNKYTGFPKWASDIIRKYNAEAGVDKYDRFGYRRFFFWYVERIADFENQFFADRGDSGIRHKKHIPLRSREAV